MPKSQFVDPDILRRPSKITFTDIDVNAYNKNHPRREQNYTKAGFHAHLSRYGAYPRI